MSNVELRHFRYFLALAEERHFGHAAERLGITQPGLSQQIKSLEGDLGVKLLVRDKRPIELTEAGETFLEHARLVLEMADRAVRSARRSGVGKRGLLRLGTGAAGIQEVASDVLREFSERFPDVEVEIQPGYAPQNLDALERHALDATFVLTPFESKAELQYFPLGHIELRVALPEGHRLAALERIPRSELLKETFVDWPKSANPALAEHLHRAVFGVPEHPRRLEVVEVVEANRLLLVAEGKGLAVPVFPLLSELHIPGVVFRRVEDPPPMLEYGLAWFDAHASPFTAAFVTLAKEVAQVRMEEVRAMGPAAP